jgi:hypothetical protein
MERGDAVSDRVYNARFDAIALGVDTCRRRSIIRR